MDLFEHSLQERIEREAPLAARMRPRTLDEFAGQAHIVGPGRLLRRAIQADQLSSLIFYGPPGTGKTTLAMIIARTTESHFITVNAVLSGVKQIREAIATAQEYRSMYGRRTILFVDEVHRWNKAQQDALLPWVENGTVILIGATTENPYFSVNRPLVSRSRIFQLKSLDEDDLRQIARQALADPDRGYGTLQVEMHEEALDHLVNVANGDARGVLNALELAVETTPPNEQGVVVVNIAVAEESIQRRAVLYDKDGDAHYDTISAYIKSLRGSDPDAALYWLAKMVYAGEDPRFIFRRMLIFCGEDVGLADPNAIGVVSACAQAFDRVGLPEGRFHLAEATLYLATAPKSNSAMAFFDALATVEREREGQVPSHLRDGSRDKEGFGHGEGYLYPHAYRDHWIEQQYLPTSMQGKVFYDPSDQGYENEIRERVIRQRQAQLAAMVEGTQLAPPEVLTFTPADRAGDRWLQRTLSGASEHLARLRDRVMAAARLERHHVALDLRAGTGLLTWEAVRRVPEGGVWALVPDSQAAEGLEQQSGRLDELDRPHVLVGELWDLRRLLEERGLPDLCFDAILGRGPLTQATASERTEVAQVLAALLAPGGRISLAQVLPRHTQRIYRLVDLGALPEGLAKRIEAAEEALYANPDDPWVNWDVEDLVDAFRCAGLATVHADVVTQAVEMPIATALLDRWFALESSSGRPTYAQHLLRPSPSAGDGPSDAALTAEELLHYRALIERTWLNQSVQWQSRTAYLVAKRATGQTF
jgi:putative ATPase